MIRKQNLSTLNRRDNKANADELQLSHKLDEIRDITMEQ